MIPVFTWSPRLGSTDDEQFDLDFGTRMDGTFAEDGEPHLGVGAIVYSAFSTFPGGALPTLLEVNGGAGLNQIIAALNYKRSQISNFDSAFVPPFSTGMSYLIPGQSTGNGLRRALASATESLETFINQIRIYEGFTAYTFTPIIAGNIFRAWAYAERRKALALIGISTSEYGSSRSALTQTDGLILISIGTSDSDINAFDTDNIGVSTFFPVGPHGTSIPSLTYIKRAQERHFRILPWMATGWVTWHVEVVISGSHGTYTGELWLSNTNDRFYPSRAALLAGCNNLVGTWTADGTYTFDLSAFASLLSDGRPFASFVLITEYDRLGTVGGSGKPDVDGHFRCTMTMIRDYGA